MLAVFGSIVVFLLGITHHNDRLLAAPESMALLRWWRLPPSRDSSYLIRETKSIGKDWLVTLGCGGSWLVGAAFYLYMPIAGATVPPMEWGYPRTLDGFIHALTRGQYEHINPTFGEGSRPPLDQLPSSAGI